MDDGPINITGIDKASILMALYNKSRPLGMGILHFTAGPLDRCEAERLISEGTSFDYLKGRVMKVHLGGDSFDPWLYDRDNGPGAAIFALESAGLIARKETP